MHLLLAAVKLLLLPPPTLSAFLTSTISTKFIRKKAIRNTIKTNKTVITDMAAGPRLENVVARSSRVGVLVGIRMGERLTGIAVGWVGLYEGFTVIGTTVGELGFMEGWTGGSIFDNTILSNNVYDGSKKLLSS